jgi:HD-GYP domain-containing protein (c-di-GMP phosphodiesterase class II)
MKFLEMLKQLLSTAQTTKDALAGMKKIFTDLKDDQDVQAYLSELQVVTAERADAFLKTEDGKRFLQPILDQYHSKGLESWKTNNLSKITADAVEKEIQKRYPAETPEQKEVRELRKRVEESEAKAARTELKNKAISLMTTKGLPTELVDSFIGADEAATTANLATLETVFNTHVTKLVEERMKNGGRAPQSTANDPKTRLQELQTKIQDPKLRLEEKIAIRNEIAALEKPA